MMEAVAELYCKPSVKFNVQKWRIVYSHKYDLVMDVLRGNERLTLLQIGKRVFGSEKEVEEILIELILAGLVNVEVTETATYFAITSAE